MDKALRCHPRLHCANRATPSQGSSPVRNPPYWLSTLPEKVAAAGAHEVWLMLPLNEGAQIQATVYALRHEVVSIRFMPQLNDLPLLNHQVSRVAGFYSIDLSVTPMDGMARIVKRVEDQVVGSGIFLMILPVCMVIALAIKHDSPGPVLFRQMPRNG